MNKITYQVKKIRVLNVCKLHRSLKAFKSDECKESRWSVLKRKMQEF